MKKDIRSDTVPSYTQLPRSLYNKHFHNEKKNQFNNPSKSKNLAINSETKFQQNTFSYFSPNTVVTRRNYVDFITYTTHTVTPFKSTETTDDPNLIANYVDPTTQRDIKFLLCYCLLYHFYE